MLRRMAPLPAVATALAGLLLGSAGWAAGSVAQPTVVSEAAVAYTPHLMADAAVSHPLALAIENSRQTMYVGGKFQSVENAERTETYLRQNIMAFDANTGLLSPTFAPDLDGTVFAILGIGDSVYVGGEFRTVDGVARPRLVKLDATTGARDPSFNPTAITGGRVSEIRLVNGRLLVGGMFEDKLLALDPLTGADTGYINVDIAGQLRLTTTKTEVYRFAVNPRGTRLVAVGNFISVDGEIRRRGFMLNLGATGAALNPWYYPPLNKKCASNAPGRQAYLEDVDYSPDGSYFVFASTGFVPRSTEEIGTALCDAAARFEAGTAHPVAPTWINYTGGDTLHAVAVTGAAVYVQGHNRWLDNPYGRDSEGLGAVSRRGIGAIDPVSGMALAWNPVKPAAQGGQDFLATPEGLWVVSDSTKFNGTYHRGIAFAPLPSQG
ncbi:MAG: delta-60 repeat domain-containing protein [Nocardioidaceae bacterium]|nr:delta-60 repeat domain-containing protein [Nocardioidaceae bacterium]